MGRILRRFFASGDKKFKKKFVVLSADGFFFSFSSHDACQLIGLLGGLVTFGFTVGKLYLVLYVCDSLECVKAVHNAVMTLGCFVFDWMETSFLHQASLGKPYIQRGLVFKMLNTCASFTYLLYDASNAGAPGTGSLVLVVLACLSEVILLVAESITLYGVGRGAAGDGGSGAEMADRATSASTSGNASDMPPPQPIPAQMVMGSSLVQLQPVMMPRVMMPRLGQMPV